MSKGKINIYDKFLDNFNSKKMTIILLVGNLIHFAIIKSMYKWDTLDILKTPEKVFPKIIKNLYC